MFFEEDDLGGEECAEGVGDEDGDVADDGADALDADPSATHFTLALYQLRHRRHRVTGVPARATERRGGGARLSRPKCCRCGRARSRWKMTAMPLAAGTGAVGP